MDVEKIVKGLSRAQRCLLVGDFSNGPLRNRSFAQIRGHLLRSIAKPYAQVTHMTDIAKIANGLSDAERRQIRLATHAGLWWEIRSCVEGDLSKLKGLELTGEDGWEDCLTPLGLAVRDYLERQGND